MSRHIAQIWQLHVKILNVTHFCLFFSVCNHLKSLEELIAEICVLVHWPFKSTIKCTIV